MPIHNLHIRTIQCFLLAENAARLGQKARQMFWDRLPVLVPDPVARLPAMIAAVRQEKVEPVLKSIACQQLPRVLPPEAVPWHGQLAVLWEEIYRSPLGDMERIGRMALMQLEGCELPGSGTRPSLLPEWLRNARMWANSGCEGKRKEHLTSLAEWRPPQGVITDPETLRDWVEFWMGEYTSWRLNEKGIAAKALLSLLDGETAHGRWLLAHQPVTAERLLHDLASAITAAIEMTDRTYRNCLQVLHWQPVYPTAFPAKALAGVAEAWLKAIWHPEWSVYSPAWREAVRWHRAGLLSHCGIDLFPHVVAAVQKKGQQSGGVMLELCRWTPEPGVTPDPAQLRALESGWRELRNSGYSVMRTAAWWAGIHLYRTGVASESPTAFVKAYLPAVAEERNADVLFVLAQWVPEPHAPPNLHQAWQTGWRSRLGDWDKNIRQVVEFALMRQALGKATGHGLRQAALETWRDGTEKADRLTHRLNSAASRWHEVKRALVDGSIPDFEATPPPPAEKQRPQLALPPGHIADGEWKIVGAGYVPARE